MEFGIEKRKRTESNSVRRGDRDAEHGDGSGHRIKEKKRKL